MERNPWKLATIGIALVGTTALSTGLTTAWMLRPAAEAQAQAAGLDGAALGAGYGAYKTKNECGTIFGGGNGFDAAPASPASRADTVQTFSPATGGDRIQVYGVR